MAAVKNWYFLDTGKSSPYFNMAMDEALFLAYQGYWQDFKLDLPVFRLYQWQPYALSLGYSQKAGRELVLENCEVPFVRRITGGGILFHAEEVTYSIIAREDDFGNFPSIKESYRHICGFLLFFYAKLGIKACFACEEETQGLGEFSSFCLAGRERYDIVTAGKKIGGNAQRRRKKYLLQHGVVPIDLQLGRVEKCIKDFSPRGYTSLQNTLGGIGSVKVKKYLQEAFIEIFNAKPVELKKEVIYKSILSRAEELIKTKYANPKWNRGEVNIDYYANQRNTAPSKVA